MPAAIDSALPPAPASSPARSRQALRELAQRTAVTALSSKQFATLWKQANRIAHDQLRKALTGTGKVLDTSNGKVVLDLSPIVARVRVVLKDRGVGIFDKIPVDQLALKFELADGHQLKKAQRATRALNTASWLLPLVMLATLGGGLYFSLDRRRSLAHWGIGVAFAVALLGLAITIGRALYLNAVTSPALPRASGPPYSTR